MGSVYPKYMIDISSVNRYIIVKGGKADDYNFPAGVVVSYAATGDERIKEKALANAIPEFIRFNIVESEVRNVC